MFAKWFVVDEATRQSLGEARLGLEIVGGLLAGLVLGMLLEMMAERLGPVDTGQGVLAVFVIGILYLLMALPLGGFLYAGLRWLAGRSAFGYGTVLLVWTLAMWTCFAAMYWGVARTQAGGFPREELGALVGFAAHFGTVFGAVSGTAFWWFVGLGEPGLFRGLAGSRGRAMLLTFGLCAGILFVERLLVLRGMVAV